MPTTEKISWLTRGVFFGEGIGSDHYRTLRAADDAETSSSATIDFPPKGSLDRSRRESFQLRSGGFKLIFFDFHLNVDWQKKKKKSAEWEAKKEDDTAECICDGC